MNISDNVLLVIIKKYRNEQLCKKRSILINSEISRCYFLTYLLKMYSYVQKGKKIEGSIKTEV